MMWLRQATMKRAPSAVALLLLLLVVFTEIAAAAPLPQEQQCEITAPRPDVQVRGSVEIIGTARLGPQFWFYKVEYASAAGPDVWVPIGQLPEEERTNARLETWHTAGLPDGPYYLRLTCVRLDGNYVVSEPIPVQVANAQPVPTPTPEETPTPTPIIVLPTPTPAIVEQPTVIRRTPTATPVPGGEPSPMAESGASDTVSLPDMSAFVRQFVFGAFVATVIFLFVGVVLLLRRLI